MRTVNIAIAATIFMLVVFAGLNWAAFTESKNINLLFYEIQGPLGVVTLGVVGLLSVVYGVALGQIQTSAWLESRRTLIALEEARRVADSKEDSRIHELQELVCAGFDRVADRVDTLVNRFDAEDAKEAIRKEGDEIEGRIGKAETALKRELKDLRKVGAG